MKEIEYKFIVKTKEAGQRSKYGDSFYHYIVKSNLDPYMIEAFCKHVLNPAIPDEQYREEEHISTDNHFRRYWTIYEVIENVGFFGEGMNEVEYKVVIPSTH
ncbi:MAG: hypothetical protein GY793_03780 [Proteobacteria bacterium]|nr:hypothetical protein [Pseudomonadota bacterium]